MAFLGIFTHFRGKNDHKKAEWPPLMVPPFRNQVIALIICADAWFIWLIRLFWL